jgi:hypothetical protein
LRTELKASADHVSGGAGRLKPVLDAIEQLARDLKALRVNGDAAQLSALEPSILYALREVEAGNARLGSLIDRLIGEGAEFEGLMSSAQDVMTGLGKGAATLPGVATRLHAAGVTASGSTPAASDKAAFDKLFSRYTMERERDVHRQFLRGFGLAPSAPAPSSGGMEEADDGVLLF